MTSTPMTAAAPVTAGVLSLRSENTNSDTTSAAPIREFPGPVGMDAAAPAVVTVTATHGGQRMMKITVKIT